MDGRKIRARRRRDWGHLHLDGSSPGLWGREKDPGPEKEGFETLWSECRRAGIRQVSTGHLHLGGSNPSLSGREEDPGAEKEGFGTLWSECRQAGIRQVSTGHLHLIVQIPLSAIKKTLTRRVKVFFMAGKEGFEPSIPFWGIHDFQSCALGQLRDFSMRVARFLLSQTAWVLYYSFFHLSIPFSCIFYRTML